MQNGTFDTIIPGVQNGRFAVGEDNFGVTAAREKIVDFATSLTDGQALLAPSDSTLRKITDITRLCGLTVGTGAGTTFQTISPPTRRSAPPPVRSRTRSSTSRTPPRSGGA